MLVNLKKVFLGLVLSEAQHLKQPKNNFPFTDRSCHLSANDILQNPQIGAEPHANIVIFRNPYCGKQINRSNFVVQYPTNSSEKQQNVLADYCRLFGNNFILHLSSMAVV